LTVHYKFWHLLALTTTSGKDFIQLNYNGGLLLASSQYLSTVPDDFKNKTNFKSGQK
jgi:hypothetical protein